jgi:Zn-dependent M16 (insulinase) family peptidase
MVEMLHLSARLDPTLIARLNEMATRLNANINDTIFLALDALEREQKVPETVAERIESLVSNLRVLAESVTLLNQKMDHHFSQASFDEKERLKSLLKLLGEQIQHHDEAERARFERINPGAL